MDHLCYFCLVLLCFCVTMSIDALWSPAGKGLTSWLSFVMSYCEFVIFPLVSWVRCGAWLYRFLIFALFLTFHPPLYLCSFFRTRHVYTSFSFLYRKVFILKIVKVKTVDA